MSTVATWLLWLVVLPIVLGLVGHFLAWAIPQLYKWGRMWSGELAVLPTVLGALLIRRPYPRPSLHQNDDDVTPIRQAAIVGGTWVVGVPAAIVLYFVWRA